MIIEVPEEYGCNLVHEVSDPFIVAALLPSLIQGEDIECDTISDDLYYHSKTILYLLSKVFRRKPIKVLAKRVVHLDWNGKAVGTGFSGGVDSLCTYINHVSEDCPDSFHITHLTLFNVGAYGNDFEYSQIAFQKDKERASRFASSEGKPFITVNTNIGVLYNHKDISNYSLRSTLCLSVGILSLSKLFKTYFISSTGTIDGMKLNRFDQYYYEDSLVQLLSNHNTQIFISETDLNRVEKTRIIASSPLSKENLYVCAADIMNEKFGTNYRKEKPNCSECFKCERTLLTLDYLGVLDEYKDRFDIDKYRKNKNKHLKNIAIKRDYDHFAKEISDLIDEKGKTIPFGIRVQGYLIGLKKRIHYQLFRK